MIQTCFLLLSRAAGEKVAIKKITNVFDHVSGGCCRRRRCFTRGPLPLQIPAHAC